MRPNKPGYWWWEDDNGMFHVAEFDKDMETFEYNCYMTIEEFEDEFSFRKWIGPAHPPITRDVVSWFAHQMELKLKENDHKGCWSESTNEYLFKRLQEEIEEFKMAVKNRYSPFGNSIEQEAADVANFCMMIADNCRNQIWK
jgi:NTP pyrophosphatase (non-canonical NTP hydrolase)